MLEPERKTAVKKQTDLCHDPHHGASRWVCRVAASQGGPVEMPIGSVPITLGAAAACDIVIPDPTVSGRHAQVAVVADGIQIRDMGSTNGTFYRSSKFETITVTADARIRLGDTEVAICASKRPALPASDRFRFGGLIGQSTPVRQVFAILERVSPTDATVLIEGESGTGKELAARGIHDHSRRAEKPFIVVDCCAGAENLIESHLFGHRAGAFTGATSDRKGAFLEANGGTIFLDELGELPLGSQGKLLRALEAHTVQPVGSDRTVPVDVRIIAATNRDLTQMVAEKTFRFDLYHRLAVVGFAMPPLREHLEDIPLLVRHFYEGRGVDPGDIAGMNLATLMQHDWPGNVRELRNILERAWVLSGPEGARFDQLDIMLGRPQIVPPVTAVSTALPFKEAKEQWVDFFEQRYISQVYAEQGRNISHAAEHAGINRNHFRKLLTKHGIA